MHCVHISTACNVKLVYILRLVIEHEGKGNTFIDDNNVYNCRCIVNIDIKCAIHVPVYGRYKIIS